MPSKVNERSAAAYVGRVGGLAVVLGVGTAVFAGHGVASAETSDSNSAASGAKATGHSSGALKRAAAPSKKKPSGSSAPVKAAAKASRAAASVPNVRVAPLALARHAEATPTPTPAATATPARPMTGRPATKAPVTPATPPVKWVELMSLVRRELEQTFANFETAAPGRSVPQSAAPTEPAVTPALKPALEVDDSLPALAAKATSAAQVARQTTVHAAASIPVAPAAPAAQWDELMGSVRREFERALANFGWTAPERDVPQLETPTEPVDIPEVTTPPEVVDSPPVAPAPPVTPPVAPAPPVTPPVAPAPPVTPPVAGSTPYLPFDMPVGLTTKKVFAHYVPWFPVSIDNKAAAVDYYTTQYLNPTGEAGAHAAYGGFVRDRPLPRAPINDPNWKYDDVLTEVNQARSVGIDGFTVDIVDPGSQNDVIGNLLRAAQATPGFSIQPTADMSGSLKGYTSSQFAAAFAPILTSPGTYKLSDGRVVLGAFDAETQSPTWWNTTLTTLRDNYQVNVAFVPTFLNAPANMDAFAPFSYGFGNWGDRNPAATDPTSTSAGSPAALIAHAHALGKIWMQPVAFQDSRPLAGLYQESGNVTTNSNLWQAATDNGAEWVQLITWNDYAETTAMAPSVGHGYGLLDMQAYSIAKFKYGVNPTVLRDALYVSNRSQPAAALGSFSESMPMKLWPGTPAAVDTVEVVAFATAPSTIVATIGGVTSTCQVGAGRSTCTFPLRVGDVVVTMQRNGVSTTTVASPYTVTATPTVQDLQYHIAGGLR